MATEELIIKLNAKTSELDARLKRSETALDKLDTTVKKTDKSLLSFSKVASGVGKGLGVTAGIAKKAAIGFLAFKGAVTAAALASAKYSKEIKNNSDLMRMSVEDTQAWASATQSVGIDLEKLGDISKDTNEKIGQFLTMGGGGFEDFGDAMGYTKEQTLEAAQSFKGLAGPDILQAMVSQMESAGVGADDMSFALEGMASDTTKLIPLLKDGGKVLKDLKNDFRETAVVLSETDIEKLGELSTSFKQLGETFDGTMGKFSVEYADQINGMIESTQEGLKIIGDEFASGSFTDRLNSFYDAFTDSWAVAMGDNISIFDDFTEDGGELISSLGALWLDFALTLPINFVIAGKAIKEIFLDILDSIKISLAEANLLVQEGLNFVGIDSDVEGAQAKLDAIVAETDARDVAHDAEINRLESEKEAILAKFMLEQELATIKREQYAADSVERLKRIDEEDKAERKKVNSKSKGDKIDTKSSSEKVKAEEKGKADLTKNAAILNEQLFNDNKAIGAGIIVAETAQNVVASVKNSGGIPWGLPAGAAAAAMGVAQLSALKGASKGGGSISSGGTSAPPQQRPNFEAETTGLEVTDASAQGASTQTIRFAIDSGDELIDAISNALNKANSEGR
jgi:hypothetical protein